MPSAQDFDSPISSIDQKLGDIDRLLHQMLLLAELSSSDLPSGNPDSGNLDATGNLTLDREALQTILERLQQRIDTIADDIKNSAQGV